MKVVDYAEDGNAGIVFRQFREAYTKYTPAAWMAMIDSFESQYSGGEAQTGIMLIGTCVRCARSNLSEYPELMEEVNVYASAAIARLRE